MHDVQIGEEHPQVQNRGTRTFRDQHGRRWGAVIENKTGHPVHPPTPRFQVADDRLMPSEKYVKVKQGDEGDIEIDYQSWHADLINAWRAYEEYRLGVATELYKDDVQKALQNPSQFLQARWGETPLNPKLVLAMIAGNHYVLGLSMVRPKWLTDELLPPRIELRLAPGAISEFEFPNAEDEDGFQNAQEPQEQVEYPVMTSPGRWKLSNGSIVQGNREIAKQAEAALLEFAEL